MQWIKWLGIGRRGIDTDRDEIWYNDFIVSQREKNRTTGFWLAVIGIPFIVLFAINDVAYLNMRNLWAWRLIGIAGLAIFLIAYLIGYSNKRLFSYLHTLSILSIIAMMEGITIIIYFSVDTNNPQGDELFAVTLGFMSIWFIFAMVAAGIRPYLPAISIVSLGFLALWLLIFDKHLWGYVMSIVTVAFFSNLFAYRQYRSEREEWKYLHFIRENEKKLLRQKNELESQKVVLEEQKKELERTNADLENFSSAISHDLRSPIRTASNFTYLLQRAIENGEKEGIMESLEYIKKSMNQMNYMVKDLLKLARIGRDVLKKEWLDVIQMAKNIWPDLLTEYEGLNVNLKCKKTPLVFADSFLMERVLTNLLSNALKYSNKQPEMKIEIGGMEKGNDSIFYIKDNGTGFDMKQADKLFKVFKRLHREDEFEGTGVGLALVKKIIDYHGGKIWAESEVGKGATFFVSLPKPPN